MRWKWGISPAWLAAGVVGFGWSLPTAALPVNIDVYAQGNSSSDSGVDLDTGIEVVAGDRLVSSVAADDCWSAGQGDRISNANGLVGQSSDLCRPNPTIDYGFWTQDGESFRYGALVGRIGASDWFLLGTSFNAIVNATGRLFLVYWDSNSSDNSGFVTASIDVQRVPLPGTMVLVGSALALLGLGRRFQRY